MMKRCEDTGKKDQKRSAVRRRGVKIQKRKKKNSSDAEEKGPRI